MFLWVFGVLFAGERIWKMVVVWWVFSVKFWSENKRKWGMFGSIRRWVWTCYSVPKIMENGEGYWVW